MRKITQDIVLAFIARKNRDINNSSVTADGLFLHGNKIAKFIGNDLWITSAGWQTVTTKERLNGLPGVFINQKQGQWFLNGKAWDGEWVKIERSPE